MGNPAAIYCTEMGFQYEIIADQNGQLGICHLPDNQNCEAWDFLQGTCGQEYSHCAQNGYQVKVKTDGMNSISNPYGVCVTENGREVGPVTELSNLTEKTSTCAENSVDQGISPLDQIDQVYIPRDTIPPSNFDWRDNNGNWLPPVKSQGGCGSCWAFSAVGVVEAKFNIASNDPNLNLDLSEQYLVSDCYSGNNCCGGSNYGALIYIKNYGLPDENCLPYVDGTTSIYDTNLGCDCNSGSCSSTCSYNTPGKCSDTTCSDRCNDWLPRSEKIINTGVVPSEPATIKQALVDKGPLSAWLYMDGYWHGDIYRCLTGTNSNSHAISIVGYNDPGGYWIVRNSWGYDWNGDGYFKVGYGECSIGSGVFYVDANPPKNIKHAYFDTKRVSVASDGSEGIDQSWDPSLSGDGRYVAYQSDANNLVSGDNNGVGDIFLHNTMTGGVIRVSVASNGNESNGISETSSISSFGRFITFTSSATNLISGDTNGVDDIFLHDSQTGFTTRVSVASNGSQGNSLSFNPSISGDGRYVSFASYATNLVPDDTNASSDIFLHDTQTGQTTRVSVSSAGSQGDSFSSNPSISIDGRYVAFASYATNLVSGDTNGSPDIFLRDTQTGQTTRVSVSSAGIQGNNLSYFPSLSSDGRFVAYESKSSNLVSGDTNGVNDVFLHDAQTGQTVRVSIASDGSQAWNESEDPSISGNGRIVAFASSSNLLVVGDTNRGSDIYLHDTLTGQTTRVSVNNDGVEGYGSSYKPSLSQDGLKVAYYSNANNLVSGDNNDVQDVFLTKTLIFSDVFFDHWAYPYIEAIAVAGLTGGYPDGTYRPENRVTRAEMAVFLLKGMGVTAPPLDGSHPFPDIDLHWAEIFIEELYDQGITGGYDDGTYRPENRVTRAEMAVFLLKGIGVTPPPIDGSHPFSDIEGHWAEIFIEELEDQGITGGYPDGTYRPENRVTRAEMAVFLVNTFGISLP